MLSSTGSLTDYSMSLHVENDRKVDAGILNLIFSEMDSSCSHVGDAPDIIVSLHWSLFIKYCCIFKYKTLLQWIHHIIMCLGSKKNILIL